MTKIQIYDPALCCSTGICGTNIDQALVIVAGDIEWLKQQGVSVERFNLGQQPLAFAQTPAVKSSLERLHSDALPLTLVDGDVVLTGRYPTRSELAGWAGLSAELSTERPSFPTPEKKCCCGS